MELAPQEGELWVPRVLVSASAGSRSGLLDELRRQGFAVLLAPTDGLQAELERGDVDVVLLSTDGRSALDQLLALRPAASVPVVVLLRNEKAALQRLFDAGADDCVFCVEEVGGRLRAALQRRQQHDPAGRLRAGRFVIDIAQHVFTIDGQPVHLPPKEFGLLALLLRRDGRVVSREEALTLVWGPSRSGDPTTVDVHVKRLRTKLEPEPGAPQHLLTVRGLGYRFRS